jgi:hypothetical protein
MRGKELTRLQNRIVELSSNEGKLSHELKENNKTPRKATTNSTRPINSWPNVKAGS